MGVQAITRKKKERKKERKKKSKKTQRQIVKTRWRSCETRKRVRWNSQRAVRRPPGSCMMSQTNENTLGFSGARVSGGARSPSSATDRYCYLLAILSCRARSLYSCSPRLSCLLSLVRVPPSRFTSQSLLLTLLFLKHRRSSAFRPAIYLRSVRPSSVSLTGDQIGQSIVVPRLQIRRKLHLYFGRICGTTSDSSRTRTCDSAILKGSLLAIESSLRRGTPAGPRDLHTAVRADSV